MQTVARVQKTLVTNKKTFMQYFVLQTRRTEHFVFNCNSVAQIQDLINKIVPHLKMTDIALMSGLANVLREAPTWCHVYVCFKRGHVKNRKVNYWILCCDIRMHGGFNALQTCGVLWLNEFVVIELIITSLESNRFVALASNCEASAALGRLGGRVQILVSI